MLVQRLRSGASSCRYEDPFEAHGRIGRLRRISVRGDPRDQCLARTFRTGRDLDIARSPVLQNRVFDEHGSIDFTTALDTERLGTQYLRLSRWLRNARRRELTSAEGHRH